ncbi:hypothetical protein ATCV1_z657R [Acanthocystis turfacea chlorella virus 1]|uniref:Uncharacterized protein z657R n=1 Tax=Chlorovirus heliozoae TaxID=322019 RepID=A7K9R7_9PHYC|nr:hypothetical protein ATCV1_z657R [Acanthocystis turfacea chlorella virus 1]ABT16791.1 hypothetical protein ATCV1_z657R [Acanthocystis turfacea chlorella virus 1]
MKARASWSKESLASAGVVHELVDFLYTNIFENSGFSANVGTLKRPLTKGSRASMLVWYLTTRLSAMATLFSMVVEDRVLFASTFLPSTMVPGGDV